MDIGLTYTTSKNSCLLPCEILDLLNSRFHIIDVMHFKQFDLDWSHLRKILTNTKKSVYAPDDRYIIIHQDTDVYIPEMCVGLNLRNFFQIVRAVDIPFYTFVIWTNHFGIQREIDILCQDLHPKDRPMLIESFCATTHVGDNYRNTEVDQDQIEYHAISMMGTSRSHRYALYTEIKHVGTDKLVLSIGNNQ